MRITPLFLVITALFITCLLTANIIAAKLISVGGFVIPGAIVIFPLSYVFGDVLTEVYGFRQARLVVWLGFLCNLLAITAITVVGAIPPFPFWNGDGAEAQKAYDLIFSATPRILAASFIAYLIGEYANSVVLARMKVATGGKWLWTRTIGSTVVGEGLDSTVFITIAFLGTPGFDIPSAIFGQWVLKVIYEAAVTPGTYWLVNFLKAREGIDVYDVDTSFNPLPHAN